MFVTDVLMLALFLLVLLVLVKPVGIYIAKAFQGEIRFGRPVEQAIYRIAGVDPSVEMGWKKYAVAMLAV